MKNKTVLHCRVTLAMISFQHVASKLKRAVTEVSNCSEFRYLLKLSTQNINCLIYAHAHHLFYGIRVSH